MKAYEIDGEGVKKLLTLHKHSHDPKFVLIYFNLNNSNNKFLSQLFSSVFLFKGNLDHERQKISLKSA